MLWHIFDDILITCSSSMLDHKLIYSFHDKLAVNKLGISEYFLSIEIKHLSSGNILLTQSKYIQNLLAKENIFNANGVTTPMLKTCKLRRHGSSLIPNPHMYRSMVGALQYVTSTLPDIAFSIN